MVPARRGLLLLGFLVALGCFGLSRSVTAQQPYQGIPPKRAAPYRPKLSPYLDLLRRDDSVLSPYHSFVLPRRELHRQQRAQAAEISQLRRATHGRARPGGRGTPSRLTTGNGGYFQTYLHFYGSTRRP